MGSSTVSPGFVSRRMNHSGSWGGKLGRKRMEVVGSSIAIAIMKVEIAPHQGIKRIGTMSIILCNVQFMI
jgi:hypothetical protein